MDLRKDRCGLCAGSGRHRAATRFQVKLKVGAPLGAAQVETDVDDVCPRCRGLGQVTSPPYGDGGKAKITTEKVSELAAAATLLRCIGDRKFIEAIANRAAAITLPDEVVQAFEDYWVDPGRDVSLGGFIRQIAEYAEDLAIRTYGSLKNDFYDFARSHNPQTDGA